MISAAKSIKIQIPRMLTNENPDLPSDVINCLECQHSQIHTFEHSGNLYLCGIRCSTFPCNLANMKKFQILAGYLAMAG